MVAVVMALPLQRLDLSPQFLDLAGQLAAVEPLKLRQVLQHR
jgi:hypothetical protein